MLCLEVTIITFINMQTRLKMHYSKLCKSNKQLKIKINVLLLMKEVTSIM